MSDHVILGEWSNMEPGTPAIQEMLDTLQTKVEDKISMNFDTFKVKLYQVQVMKGKNFRVKVDVGDDEYIHVRVFEDEGGKLTLRSVQINKAIDDVF